MPLALAAVLVATIIDMIVIAVMVVALTTISFLLVVFLVGTASVMITACNLERNSQENQTALCFVFVHYAFFI
jgi:hypothetical protein